MIAGAERLKVVLVSPRNPLNIGAAARAMSNFGMSNLRLVNAYEVAYAEARSAVNASHVLEASVQFASVAEAVADCSLVIGTASHGHREFQHSMQRLESGALAIKEHLAGGEVALLFGSEKFGLSNEDMSHCHWLMHIPARPEHESMNLGQAVAVCLYELIRDEGQAKRPEPLKERLASSGDLDRLSQYVIEALELSGYVEERTAESTKNKVRRLVHRMGLSERDGKVWLGMLRQVLWKLKTGMLS